VRVHFRCAFICMPLILAACANDVPRDPEAGKNSVKPIAFTAATVIDGTGAPAMEGATVVIEGSLISCVGKCEIPSNAEVIDTAGRYIIPGLVDVHVHYGLSGWMDTLPGLFGIDVSEKFPFPDVLADLRANPQRFHRSYLCSGVTAVFDTGDYPWTLDLREEAEQSTAAPHIAAAGPILTTLEYVIGHPAGSEMSVHMADEQSVRKAVRMLADNKSDGVKIHRPDLLEDRERRHVLLRTASEEARQAGLRLIANAPTLESAKDALRAGASLFVYSVEDALVDEEFIELARLKGIVYAPALAAGVGANEIKAREFNEDRMPLDCVDPETRKKVRLTDSLPIAAGAEETIIPEQGKAVRQRRLENLRRIHEAGIAVAIGASGGAPLTLHGPATANEMEAVASAGLTPMAVLVAATQNGAIAMGRTDFGTLEPGKIADLVVLERDPLADISNVRSVALVVRGGKVWTREDLEYR